MLLLKQVYIYNAMN